MPPVCCEKAELVVPRVASLPLPNRRRQLPAQQTVSRRGSEHDGLVSIGTQLSCRWLAHRVMLEGMLLRPSSSLLQMVGFGGNRLAKRSLVQRYSRGVVGKGDTVFIERRLEPPVRLCADFKLLAWRCLHLTAEYMPLPDRTA